MTAAAAGASPPPVFMTPAAGSVADDKDDRTDVAAGVDVDEDANRRG